MINGFRLTLSSGVPVTTGSVASSSMVYLTPYTSGRIALYDPSSTSWGTVTSNEASLSLGTLVSGSNYDVFAYKQGSSVKLELGDAWYSSSARTSLGGGADILNNLSSGFDTDLFAVQDGVIVKANDRSRRYVGTLRMTNATTTDDSTSKRFVWNYYNRVPRHLSVVDTTNTWTYIGPMGVWRRANANPANYFEIVAGSFGQYRGRAQGLASLSVTGAGLLAAVGIGNGSTTRNDAQVYGAQPNSTTTFTSLTALYKDRNVAGYSAIFWLETGYHTYTYTFAGDNGTTVAQTGMVGEIMG